MLEVSPSFLPEGARNSVGVSEAGLDINARNFRLSVGTLQKILGVTTMDKEIGWDMAAVSRQYDKRGKLLEIGITNELHFQAYHSSYQVIRAAIEANGGLAVAYAVRGTGGDWADFVWQFNQWDQSSSVRYKGGRPVRASAYAHGIIQERVWRVFIRAMMTPAPITEV